MKPGTSLSAILTWLQRNWQLLAILGVILHLVRVRLTNDADFRLSIGTDDTPGYLVASQVPLGSWEFFTSLRPLTLPLLLKVKEPEAGYQLDVFSRPAAEGQLLPPPGSAGL